MYVDSYWRPRVACGVVEDVDPKGNGQAKRHDDRQLVGLVVLFTLLAIVGWWVWGKVTQADDNSKSAASATTTAPAGDEAEVEAAYRAYETMVTRLLLGTRSDDPELPERAAGRMPSTGWSPPLLN